MSNRTEHNASKDRLAGWPVGPFCRHVLAVVQRNALGDLLGYPREVQKNIPRFLDKLLAAAGLSQEYAQGLYDQYQRQKAEEQER